MPLIRLANKIIQKSAEKYLAWTAQSIRQPNCQLVCLSSDESPVAIPWTDGMSNDISRSVLFSILLELLWVYNPPDPPDKTSNACFSLFNLVCPSSLFDLFFVCIYSNLNFASFVLNYNCKLQITNFLFFRISSKLILFNRRIFLKFFYFFLLS